MDTVNITDDEAVIKELEQAYDMYAEQDVRISKCNQSCCGTLRCGTVGSVQMIVPKSSFKSYEEDDGFTVLQDKGHLLVLDTGDAVWSSEVQVLPKAETLQ